MEDMTNKEKADFIVKLLPYATPKYSHKTYEEDVLDSPLFHDIQIVTTTDEKERLDKVRAYEEKTRSRDIIIYYISSNQKSIH